MVDLNLSWKLHPDPIRLQIEHLQKGVIVVIEENRRASCGTQFHGSAHMVNVSVRNHNLFYGEIVFLDDRQNIGNVIAGIDDHGFERGLISDDGAVAL